MAETMHCRRALFALVAFLAGGDLATGQGAALPGAPPPFQYSDPPPRSMPPPLPAGAPMPSPDPRNLDGVWYHIANLQFQIGHDALDYRVPFNVAGRKVMNRRLKSVSDGMPYINASARCFPVGQPWLMDANFPFRIVQSRDRFEFLFQLYHGYFQVSMEPNNAPPMGYMGRSIGHWDGDTLVVETTGYRDGLWLDVNGTPTSKDARLTMRIRKVLTDHWFLEVQFTLDDPAYYTRPWSWMRDYWWRPDTAAFPEYNCELQAGAKNGIDPSLVPEPQD